MQCFVPKTIKSQFLLHYIYQGDDVTLNDEEDPLGELLEILNLAEKYGMTQLVRISSSLFFS